MSLEENGLAMNKWWARDQVAPFRLYHVLKGHMSGIDSMIENTTCACRPSQLEDVHRIQMTFHNDSDYLLESTG